MVRRSTAPRDQDTEGAYSRTLDSCLCWYYCYLLHEQKNIMINFNMYFCICLEFYEVSNRPIKESRLENNKEK